MEIMGILRTMKHLLENNLNQIHMFEELTPAMAVYFNWLCNQNKETLKALIKADVTPKFKAPK